MSKFLFFRDQTSPERASETPMSGGGSGGGVREAAGKGERTDNMSIDIGNFNLLIKSLENLYHYSY